MDLDPDLVQVELFANGVNGEPPAILKMKRETKIRRYNQCDTIIMLQSLQNVLHLIILQG